MKKIIAVLVSIGIVCLLAGCSNPTNTHSTENSFTSSNSVSTSSEGTNTDMENDWETSDVVSENSENMENDGETSSVVSDNLNSKDDSVNTNISSDGGHVHKYSSKITKESTCADFGEEVFTCSCGDVYKRVLLKLFSHKVSKAATCTSPAICDVCGVIVEKAYGHDYAYYNENKCVDCGKLDPEVESVLAKCSLKTPVLPCNVVWKGYDPDWNYRGDRYVKISKVNYDFSYPYKSEENVTLKIAIEGTAGVNTSMIKFYVGWKIYDANNVVVKSGKVELPGVNASEKYQAEFNVDLSPGEYRVEFAGGSEVLNIW